MRAMSSGSHQGPSFERPRKEARVPQGTGRVDVPHAGYPRPLSGIIMLQRKTVDEKFAEKWAG